MCWESFVSNSVRRKGRREGRATFSASVQTTTASYSVHTVHTVHSLHCTQCTVSVYGGGLEVFGLVSGHLSKVCSSSAPLGPLPLVYIVYTVHTVHSVQCVRWGWVNIYRLVSGHLGKGLLQLLGDSLEFLLLGHQLVLQPVNLRGRRGGHIIILPVCTSWKFYLKSLMFSVYINVPFYFLFCLLHIE